MNDAALRKRRGAVLFIEKLAKISNKNKFSLFFV
jgi:hypothetical protein